MKYLESESFLGEAECSEDAVKSSKLLQIKLDEKRQALSDLTPSSPVSDRLGLTAECGYILLDLQRHEEAWGEAKTLLNDALQNEDWLHAVEACDILYQAEQPDSQKALAQGIWLGVTFPVDPELSVAMLQHLVDETPDNSDGGAVAAATAAYIADLRATGPDRDSLLFFTHQLLGQVARRHSQVEEQEIFDFWVERMALDNPAEFLPRLSKVLDVVTDGDWWFDRDALRAKIPAED